MGGTCPWNHVLFLSTRFDLFHLQTSARKLPTVAMGNKIDDASRRKVPLDKAVRWGDKQRVKVFEVSAKLGLYIQLSVEYLVELIKSSPQKWEICFDSNN